MRFQLNMITLALLAASAPALAGGYSLQNANTDKVKYDAWVCKGCALESGTNGTVGVGVGYQDSDDIRSANSFGSDEEVPYKLDADVRNVTESGYRTEFSAENLGMDNGRASLKTGRPGSYNISLDYRSIKTYESDTVVSPFQGIGSGKLTLPGDWVYSGSSDGMSGLSGASPFELSLKRERAGLGFEYQSESAFATYVNYQREEKTGIKTASGSFFNQSIMLPEPVDYTTDTLEAGVKVKGDHGFLALVYNGSRFSNGYSELSFDNPFHPTFGAARSGAMALDPDNQAHTVSLQGLFNDGTSQLTGRLMAGQMSQDEPLVTTGYGYTLPVEAVDAKVDIIGMSLKASSRVSKDLRLSGSYDYNDRDNKTQVEEWTQISISNVSGKVAYNTPYDHTSHRFKAGADYRISRGIKLDGGLDYRVDERSYQDRESTDETTGWARLRINSFEHWDIAVKGSYGKRGGSEYQASEWTSSENNPLLRKYYLADRNRTQAEMRVTHMPLDSLSLDFGVRYALDDYDATEVGLTESKDLGYDASLSWQLTDKLLLSSFYNHQTIDSAQAGSSNFGNANWFSDIEDKVDVYGIGLAWNELMDSRLKLGLDYSYSDSSSSTQVRQGITGDYGDYYAKVHNLNLYAQYQATERMAVRLDYRMENYKDNDVANDIAVDGIWNLVSFGPMNHDYNAHLIMLSMSYRL